MAIEIERKFLATRAVLELCRFGTVIVQGYLYTDAENTVRVRRMGARYLLAWKGRRDGAVRQEIEFELPAPVGAALLGAVDPGSRIEKVRYRIEAEERVWDVDVFAGALDGLILAEAELAHADEAVALPAWIGEEVTADERYRNSRLAAGAGVPRRAAA
jgi:adenylate cyclase